MRIKFFNCFACLLLPVFLLANCSNIKIPEDIRSLEIYQHDNSREDMKIWSYVINDEKIISEFLNDLVKIKKTEFDHLYNISMKTGKDKPILLATDGRIFELKTGKKSVHYSLDEPLSILSFKAVAQEYSDKALNNTEWEAQISGGKCSFSFFTEKGLLMCAVKIPGSEDAEIVNETFPVLRDGSVLTIGNIQLFPDIKGLRMKDTVLSRKQ